MNDYQITKLKKELQRKQELLKQEKEDHKLTKDALVKIQAERDRFYNELIINRQTIEKVDFIMAEKMKEIKAKLEEQNADSLSQLQKLKDQLLSEKMLREKISEQIKNKDSVISELSLRLKQMSRKYKDPSLLVNTKELSEQAAVTNNNYYKLTEKYNKVCADLQNIMAENKILRKLHGVPENFGFDLEEIKIAEKQQLQDYKAQCRKLETQIEELEEQRTQLRYRLRQFHSLYSNKGERYKDMTNQQLELLDQFALNLKEGKVELPQIDKSHKEMQREIIKLKAQIEILQNKAAPQFIQRNNPQQENPNQEKLAVDALRKLEDQFVKLLNPLRDDLKKITEQGVKTVEIVQEPQHRVYNDPIKSQGSEFRPPTPLPVVHNDWSHIKQGFSYLYGSKIPINLKDVSDEGGFNIAKAKYEVAALQLQNIESLKLVKQKQVIERKLMKQVQDIKGKYQKCVRVQDELFLKYFKEKEERNEKLRKLEIELKNVESQKRQVESNLAIVTDSFNALTKKTDLENKCAMLTSRLAISDSQLLKLTRKYEVLQEETQILRNSYTSLQSKSATGQYALKEKLNYAKKSQKELTFYLRKLLQEVKDSVGGDVHKTLLNQVQVLTDRSVNSSIKETELRVKINQLQNIQRQINLKDDIIQTIRDDNFDLILQLQITKNRLEATDPDYRQFQAIFRKFIDFINKNNVSLSTYFKKFDKDGSGELGKTEFISAIKALGFTIQNNEFQLLFSEFDLDGSQAITYREFLRKMRRSGVMTRNSQEDALYRLFKAIKQANITVRKAFQIIDKDGSNEVSKTEMETAFRKIGIDVTASTVDYIFKICDNDMNGTINCNQLEKLFEDIIRDSAIQEKEVFGNEMDWKFLFVLKMEEISSKYHKGGLKQTFSTLDTDGTACLTLNELTEFFRKANIDLPRKQLLELFQFLDRHRDGKVQYFQFLKILQEAKQQKKRTDRIKYIKARTEQLRRENQGNAKQSVSKGIAQEKASSVKLMSLESKHSSLIKKNQKLIKNLVGKEQESAELKKEIEDLQKNIDQVRTEFYREKEANVTLQEKIKSRISSEESKKILLQSKQKQVELLDAKNNLQLYKNLYQDLSTRNRYDQLRIAKVQSQLEKYYQIVKDLQSLSDINAELGKKVYELQVSKRNQQIVNKKYEQAIQEVRLIQSESKQLSEQSLQKEREIVNAHFFFQQKSQLMQRTIDQLSARILPTLSPQRVDQILLKIRQISNSKTQLEKENKQIRELNFNLQVRNDYIENQKLHIEELQKKLRRTYTDESSLTIIDLTKKLSEYKMGELKAKRESGLLKEKQEYYLRVNNNQTENIKELEAELANWEKKFNEREQFWRKRLADQIKLMEELQNAANKTKQEERNAEKYFVQQHRQDRVVEQKFETLPQEKQSKLSGLLRRNNNNNSSNQNIVFELKSKIQELQEELMQKEKEIYQLKSTFKQMVPESRFNDFAGQMGASTTNFLMQTELTTSQLRNNARRFINNQKDQQEYYREEALKITQAAQQSIDTLQRIIDDKNDQLKRKEQLIESLKKQFLKNKQQDCRQIQLLNEQIRQLKTRLETASLNEVMGRTINRNMNLVPSRSNEVLQLREIIDKKQEEIKMLQQKYDKLYILKEKKGQEVPSAERRAYEKKIDDLLQQKENEKRKYLENEDRLTLKIKNLEKLSKEKDLKLAKLQKTLLDLKNMAVNEVSVKDNLELQEQLKDAIVTMNKGKTANQSKMQMTMQKSLQAVQELTKKNKEYEHQVRRLKEEKLTKTTFRK